MSLTPSTMLALGTRAPDFNLPDTNGKKVSLSDFKNIKGLLVIFMCNHCPYVVHLKVALAELGMELHEKNVAMVGINSNDADRYQSDSPEIMVKEVKEFGYAFPYLFDATQEVAKAYKAACTPDIYLFDVNQKLVYRGQFDDSRPENGKPVTGKDLRSAIENLLASKPIPHNQRPSIGCSIKWKPGNEPEYF